VNVEEISMSAEMDRLIADIKAGKVHMKEMTATDRKLEELLKAYPVLTPDERLAIRSKNDEELLDFMGGEEFQTACSFTCAGTCLKTAVA
jgi:hypothetical protein